MGTRVTESYRSKNLTATGAINTGRTKLAGFYVNSTTAGTLVLKSGGAGGVAMGGLITPAVGFHKYPAEFPNTAHATIGGTLDVTFFFE